MAKKKEPRKAFGRIKKEESDKTSSAEDKAGAAKAKTAAHRVKSKTAKAQRLEPASRPFDSSKRPSPTKEQIAQRAYELFLARGGRRGYHMEDWFEAKTALENEMAAAGSEMHGDSGASRRDNNPVADSNDDRALSEQKQKRMAILRSTFGLWKDRDDLPDIVDLRKEWDERLGRIYREHS